MKMWTRWTIVLTVTLLLATLILLPRISDAAHAKWLSRGDVPTANAAPVQDQTGAIVVVSSYHNDTSKPLRDIPPQPFAAKQQHSNENPKVPTQHKNSP